MGTELITSGLAQFGTIKQFPLNKKQEYAARLVGEGDLTQVQICEKVGCGRRTLNHWLQDPEFEAFQNRVRVYRTRYASVVMNSGLARREKRVQHLTDLHQRLRTVIKERAKDPTMQAVPGGRTGVLVRKIKSIEVDETTPDGKKRTVKKIVPEYETDVATTAEIRKIQDQIAIECGDREPDEVGTQPMTAIAISIKYDQPAPRQEPAVVVQPEAFIDLPRIEIKHDGPKNGNGQ